MEDNKYKLLTELMHYIPDVIYFKDRRGRLVLVNEAHARGLGLKPEQVKGKTDFDFFPKERAEMMAKDDRYVITTGKAIIDKIERSTRADGVDNYVSTTKIPRYDQKGRVVGLIGITRDITRRMQLEHIREEKEAIEKKLEASQELNRVKSEFVSIVSHELRTPLAIIKEALMLLLDEIAGGINEKQKDILRKAKDNTDRLKGIIDDLLDISRIETGRLKLHYSLVNFSDLLREGADFFRKQALAKGIGLDYIFPRQQLYVFLDHNRISQTLSNLISNAIKFTEEDGSIKVEFKILEDRIRVGIKDTGIGIAKADMSRLFIKFNQISGNPALERKGVGLGLAITREIVNAHGGEVWAESRLGVGSKFYFTLPLIRSLNMLNTAVRTKINALLNKGLTLYFVNLLIVNYDMLKDRMKVNPGNLFNNIEMIINKIFSDKKRFPHQEKPQIVLLNQYYGECSYLLPSIDEEEAKAVNNEIVNKLSRYLSLNKIRNIFFNVGIQSFPSEESAASGEGLRVSANLRIKKILIGPQARRWERFYCHMDINILSPQASQVTFQTIDISRGGLSFYSLKPFKTDARIEVALKIHPGDQPLSLKGKVAWLKEISGPEHSYKIGLEFFGLKDREDKILARFIRSLKNREKDAGPKG